MFAWQVALSEKKRRNKRSLGYSNVRIIDSTRLQNKDPIDYVLVCEDEVILNPDINEKINNFVTSLKDLGLNTDTFYSDIIPGVVFIKVSGSTQTLQHLSVVYNVDLEYLNHNYVPDTTVYFPFMTTPLTVPDPSSDIFGRAPLTLSGMRPKKMTSAERSLIVYKLMSETWFGDQIEEFGIQTMINLKILGGAYPLHDGTADWTEDGPLCDRQLLARYWANMTAIHKQQPLNLVQRYFGPQVGFFFAFFGFYNKMLVPVVVIGLTFFLFGFIWLPTDPRVEILCQSNAILCPLCMPNKKCEFIRISHNCNYAWMSSFFDNYTSLAFAPLLSIWSTFFVELWKQEQAIYQTKWNLTSVELDRSLRNEYLANAHKVRISPITGNTEPYVTNNIYFVRYGLSYISIFVMALLLIACIISIVLYRLKLAALSYTSKNNFIIHNMTMVSSITGSLLTVAVIKIMANIFGRISLKLTIMECHRTQTAFENSLIYKTFVMAFAINYSFLFYLIFFKESLYTYPSDVHLQRSFLSIRNDCCAPAGCLMDLSIQMFFLFLYNNIKNNFMRLIISYTTYWVAKFKIVQHKKPSELVSATRWEEDYFLLPYESHDLIEHYMELIIQYVAVTFFSVAFPIAPLMALLSNIINLRVHAIGYVHVYRRPTAQRVAGLGAWFVIVKFITFIGVTVNVCIIAFATDTVQYMMYKLKQSNVPSYIDRHFSLFGVKDYRGVRLPPNVTFCYYRGKRYPPNHPDKYQLSADYWQLTVMKLAFVFIFEHIIIGIKVLLMNVIPDIPRTIRERMIYEERKLKGTKVRLLNEDYVRQTRV